MTFPILYFIYFLFTAPLVFNSKYLAWFYTPMIFDDGATEYFNHSHTINNFLIVTLTCVVYTPFRWVIGSNLKNVKNANASQLQNTVRVFRYFIWFSKNKFSENPSVSPINLDLCSKSSMCSDLRRNECHGSSKLAHNVCSFHLGIHSWCSCLHLSCSESNDSWKILGKNALDERWSTSRNHINDAY